MKSYIFITGQETTDDEAYLVEANSRKEAQLKFHKAVNDLDIKHGGDGVSLRSIQEEWVCLLVDSVTYNKST